MTTYGFDKTSAERIASAVQSVEAERLSGRKRPRMLRSPTETGGEDGTQLVIVRDVPAMDGILVYVELAVEHPEFGGTPLLDEFGDPILDEFGNPIIDTTYLGRYIAASEARDIANRQAAIDAGEDPSTVVPVDPVIYKALTWMHYRGWMYEPFIWAVGDVDPVTNTRENLTTEETDILQAKVIRGAWRIELDYRLYLLRVDGSAREASCFPADSVGG